MQEECRSQGIENFYTRSLEWGGKSAKHSGEAHRLPKAVLATRSKFEASLTNHHALANRFSIYGTARLH